MNLIEMVLFVIAVVVVVAWIFFAKIDSGS